MRTRVLLAVVVVVGLASCGGGSEKTASSRSIEATAPATSASASGPALSKSDYVGRANALCKAMNDSIKALPAPSGGFEEMADQFTTAQAILADTLRHLRDLPSPVGDEAVVADIYRKVDVFLTDYGQFIDELRAHDQAAAKAVSPRAEADQNAANDAFNSYGLTVCGAK
jgi:hypothetical protein